MDQNNKSHTQNQIKRVKQYLMDEYGVSSEEAEMIILKIKKRKKENLNDNQEIKLTKKIQNKKFENYSPNEKHNFENKTSNQHIPEKNDENHLSPNKNMNTNPSPYESKKNINSSPYNTNLIKEPKNINKNDVQNKNVDSLLNDIIPNYNKQVAIDLNHVSLTFEIQNEKIDTLKETFIRALKRNRSEKIKINALNDISFKIYKGEKVGIIGYNGAGKSTLLNVISGIYQPDKGTVITNGKISPLLSLGAGFDYNYSGRNNILLNGAVLGYDKHYLKSKINEIIEFSELGNYIDIPIKNYSSGMLAKLGFSIATIVNPDILIIDEILSVGDVTFKKKSSDKIKSLMDMGTTVLLVSHSIPSIRELCDKAIWIDKGHLRDMGEVNKICDLYLKDAEKATNEELANIQFR